jgi:hypothetical protein
MFGGLSQLTLLNDLRTTTPDNHINRLIQYVKGILYELLTGTTKTESELNAIVPHCRPDTSHRSKPQ